jgi:catechol 2,3-dioxygenase-like lactoylglutathione lyase family enzyme
VPIRADRIYHVNSNCADLDVAVAWYEALGLVKVLRTVPSATQNGDAFGLDEVAWDAWMLLSDDAQAGLSLDLLQWQVPAPVGAAPSTVGVPGLNRLVLMVPDLDRALGAVTAQGGVVVGGPVTDGAGGDDPTRRTAMVHDPSGVAVQLVEGDRTTIEQVVVNCTDVDASLAYYRDVMGLQPIDAPAVAAAPAALHGLAVDGEVRTVQLADRGSTFSVALVQWLDPPVDPASARVRGANELGLFRMAWSTGDCDGDEVIVRAAGSEPFAPTADLSVGDDLPLLRVLFWPGPDGECLELIEVTTRSGRLADAGGDA